LTAGSGVTLIHNHPGSAGLSADDLSHLAKPGVATVVAIGHDGSIYMAAAGPAFDRVQFEPMQYAKVRGSVDQQLKAECALLSIRPAVADMHRAHVVSRALAKAGVIEYEFVLASDRRASYDHDAPLLGRASEAAAGLPRRGGTTALMPQSR